MAGVLRIPGYPDAIVGDSDPVLLCDGTLAPLEVENVVGYVDPLSPYIFRVI